MADTRNTSKEFDNSGSKPLYVPGFGCDYDFELESEKRFIHGISDAQYPRITAKEVAMLQVMDQLTDKPDWRKKVFDEKIVAKWRDEAKSMKLISEKAFEWCVTELRDKAMEGDERYTITLDAGARCIKADALVTEKLHHDLNAAIQPLLDAPVKDWHPGSNEQVLNLVHPSMYPLVYGKTRVLKSGQVMLDDILEARDDTFIAPVLEPKQGLQNSPGWSMDYQWLPCEVAFVDRKGSDVKITSYINNLPYRGHEKLYGCIEKLISISIPLWNEVLEVDRGNHNHARTSLRIVTRGALELDKDHMKWIDSLPYSIHDEVSKEKWDMAIKHVMEYLERPDRSENLQGYWTRGRDELPHDWATQWGPVRTAKWKFERVRRVVHPEPFFNCTYEDWKQGKARPYIIAYPSWRPEETEALCDPHAEYGLSIQDTFRQQGLQVIVKSAGIELTPEKPTYDGGNWHLEGMMNEHIVATAIYYFDVQNVTESRIRYRQNGTLFIEDMVYDQDDFLPLEIIFDVASLGDGKQIQEVGSIAAGQGRLLVFPNTRQHRVEPFELVDRTKPGHRRFIVLWLVDPHYRVLSTKNVPPQQFDWWKEKMAGSLHPNRHMSTEVRDMVEEELMKSTMTREQAEYYRRDLMEERTTAANDVYEEIETYDFCEH